jgi:hypothetical protein
MRTLPAIVFSLAVCGPALADPLQPARTSLPGSDQPLVQQRPDCDAGGVRPVDRRAPVRLQKLGDLPPADMHLLVIRRVAGCFVPSIVVHDVERSITRREPETAPRR